MAIRTYEENGKTLCVGLPFLISLIDTVTGSVASVCEKYKSIFVAKQPPGLLITLNDCAKFINAIFLPFLYYLYELSCSSSSTSWLLAHNKGPYFPFVKSLTKVLALFSPLDNP